MIDDPVELDATKPLSRTAQAIAALVAGAGEAGIPKDRLAPMLYMADVLARQYLGHPVTDIEWAADMLPKPKQPTGVIRLRNTGTDVLAMGHDTILEVLQEDGAWLRVRGLCTATITVRGGDIVTADITVELAEFDMTALPLQLRRPRWWHKLVPIGLPWT